MSVYLKLQEVRLKLSKMNLKKTGENKFSNYKYYELGDILPAITKLCNQFKICSVIKFSEELAELIIVDAEKPADTITFTSTIAFAEMKGVQAIQRLGAEQTYLRRYLYMNAFEIVEADVIDETNNTNEIKQMPKITKVQIKALHTLLTNKGITEDQKKEYIKVKFGLDSSKDLNIKQYKEMTDYVKKKPNKQEVE